MWKIYVFILNEKDNFYNSYIVVAFLHLTVVVRIMKESEAEYYSQGAGFSFVLCCLLQDV